MDITLYVFLSDRIPTSIWPMGIADQSIIYEDVKQEDECWLYPVMEA
jgi:hypothetical protein